MTLFQTLQNPTLVQALAHPLRAKILAVLQERQASPKQLSEELGTPLANVAYHIQVLRKLKLIRLVKKTPRRGAVEHHYKADHGFRVDDSAWGKTPALFKETLVAGALEEIGNYATGAAATGGFDHADAHLTRTRLVLDAQGWDELAKMLMEVHDTTERLQKESAKRLRASNHEGERRTGLVMMLFEATPEVPNADEAAEPPPKRASRPAKSRPAARAGKS